MFSSSRSPAESKIIFSISPIFVTYLPFIFTNIKKNEIWNTGVLFGKDAMCLWENKQQAFKKIWTLPLNPDLHCMISSTLRVLPLHPCQTSHVIFQQWPHHLNNNRYSFRFSKKWCDCLHKTFFLACWRLLCIYLLQKFCFEMLVRSPWDINLHGLHIDELQPIVIGLFRVTTLNWCRKYDCKKRVVL